MSQGYNDILGSEGISSSWTKLKDRDDAVLSSNSGTTAPSYVVEGMLWKDTTTGKLKEYHQGDWRVITILDATDVPYSGAGSGLNATDTAGAIDEVEARVDQVESDLGGNTVETSVPAGAVFTDTIYTHPPTHPATMITEDSTHKFVTDAQITSWDAKSDSSHNHSGVYEPVILDKKTGFNLDLGVGPDNVSAGNHGHGKSEVGLGNVDNTSDVDKPVSSAQQAALDGKVDDAQVLTNVPAGAVFTDTIYTHPSTHPATMILEDGDHRFVTDDEKNTWNTHNHDAAYLGISAKAADSNLLDGIDGSKYDRLDVSTIKTAGTTTFNDNILLRFGTAAPTEMFHNGTNQYMDLTVGNYYIRDNTTTKFTFARTTGDFTATGNVTAYSDIKLKTNLQVIPSALEKVQQLNGYTYDRTDIDKKDTGLIAQEVLKVLPEAVGVTEDGTMTLAYGNMVGLLVEAVKELKAEIEELKKGE